MITILVVIIALSIIILFHEGGHFVFSKLSKIKVEEFGLGYPPRIIGLAKIKSSKKWKIFFGKKVPPVEEIDSTIYSLNWIPFGGFNKIKGEDISSDEKKDKNGQEILEPDNFYARPWWQRFFSLSGGIIMNIVLAMILFSIAFSAGVPTVAEEKDLGQNVLIKDQGIQIMQVQKNSPAENSGLVMGDIISKVDDQKILRIEELQDYIDQRVDQETIFEIKRGKQILIFKIIPQKIENIFDSEDLVGRSLGGGAIGVSLAEVKIVSYSFFSAIWQGIKTAIRMFGQIVSGVYLIIKELLISQKMVGEAVGVVGIATFIGDAYHIGFVYLLQFLGLISIAIAVCQLIPFPALDGGRLLFLLIEVIRRKPVSRKTEFIVHNIGFTLLILLMIFITYKDLIRLGDRIFR